MKVYVGCSLTHASEDFKKSISNFKDKLRNKFEVLDFLGLVEGTNTDVFHWDSNCVKSCDIFIAECSYPSTGLGYEIGLANSLGKKIIAVASEDAKVTRMILGIDSPNFKFYRYINSIDEILPEIEK